MNHLINNKNCTNIFLPMKKTIIKIFIPNKNSIFAK